MYIEKHFSCISPIMKQINKNQIIIVDDDPDFTDLLHQALTSCYPRPLIKIVHSGADLLAWLQTSSHPSLIFLDIHMPGTTGMDVLRTLKSVDAYRTIPVVMLTALPDKTFVNTAYYDGASAFMTKPNSFLELVRRMQLFSHYWFSVARMPARPEPNNYPTNSSARPNLTGRAEMNKPLI